MQTRDDFGRVNRMLLAMLALFLVVGCANTRTSQHDEPQGGMDHEHPDLGMGDMHGGMGGGM